MKQWNISPPPPLRGLVLIIRAVVGHCVDPIVNSVDVHHLQLDLLHNLARQRVRYGLGKKGGREG